MKNGTTIQDLAARIQRQSNSSKDFLAPPQALEVIEHEGSNRLRLGDNLLGLNDVFHGQLQGFLRINADYYNRMRVEDPELLAINANRWLNRAEPKKRMVRTILDEGGDNRVARAFLSDRYRTLDNFSLMGAIMPTLAEAGVKVESCQLTEKRLYIKAINERVRGEVKVGDEVMAGISISNSEVGCGFLKIEPLIYTLRCTNGMIIQDSTLRKNHVGRSQNDFSEGIQDLLSDETRAADDRAFFLKVRDVAKASLDAAIFKRNLDKLKSAADQRIDGDPKKVVEATAKRFSFNQNEADGILKYLSEGGDLSQWGLSSAITRFSQDVADYDRATELEYAGSDVIEITQRDWTRLAAASAN